jgi:opacity protein-like surface antigen
MNKFKIAMLSATAAAFLAPAIASAEGMYVSIGGGYASPSKKFRLYDVNNNLLSNKHKQKSSAMVNAEFGASFGDVRAGLELAYLPKKDYKISDSGVELSGKIKNTFAMFVNGYYDINGLSEMFVPYVTAGLGFSNFKYDLNYSATDNTQLKTGYSRKKGSSFAWKVGLGSRINVSDSVALDVSYKYMNLGEVEGDKTTTKLFTSFKRNAHTFNGGVVFKF